ncbi:MAG TPA: HNH endonuclease signature motif containing protein [Caproicibacter sp.]|nr:HNH endonuclease signature motif containing protein [Caproicibacter sp.]
MPYKPKRPCAYPGCGRLAVREQYCAEHQKVMDKRYNQYERDPASNKRYGRSWKRIRDCYVREHPLCEMCLKENRFTLVDEVHHIIPIKKGGTNSRNNLMSLCQSCHNQIHKELGDR